MGSSYDESYCCQSLRRLINDFEIRGHSLDDSVADNIRTLMVKVEFLHGSTVNSLRSSEIVEAIILNEQSKKASRRGAL